MSDLARRYALESIQTELGQPEIPSHVHGTLSGYNNHGCRGPLCRMAIHEYRGKPRPPTWGPELVVWETVRSVVADMRVEREQEKGRSG